ncbi:plasmid partitioning protein RepB C-terminal domain-containing protein [Prosthecobacter algae]|jgi:ParB family chromosome partitioning protein|uniref:Plasmid partitioning protein RepB C-terminal domain-containing protein n=2 Tax=Prosthecobacter algae TaxID=1144682 RepID=A0ABP9PN84_9BACT
MYMKSEVQSISIDRIRILNPRHRDKAKFERVVQSIKNLGLKKPVKISRRNVKDGEEPGYDLVCGQGRIEACRALGFTHIPAIVVDVSKEDRLLMSLVENMARRYPAPMDLIMEIERLKTQGYSNLAISKKLDISDTQVGGLLVLRSAGEERLIDAAIKGKVPLGVAIDIAKTDNREAQQGLLKAYETRQLNQTSIRVVKKLLDQRHFFGKALTAGGRGTRRRQTAEDLVYAYQKESQRQKLMVKKAKFCEAKLVFVQAAFKQLLSNEDFINLLRAEGLATAPKFIAESTKRIK